MNDYSHQLDHNNRMNEQGLKAERNRFADQSFKNTQPTYKKWVANVGTALVHVGATLQGFSKFEQDAQYAKTTNGYSVYSTIGGRSNSLTCQQHSGYYITSQIENNGRNQP